MSPEKARSPHRYFHYFAGAALLAVRKGPWKLVLPHRSSVITEPGRDGRPGARSNHQIPLSLFNLNSDVAESANLADANPKIVQELKEAANAMRKELAPKKDKRPKK